MRCEVGTRSLQYRAWLTLLCEDLVTGTLTPSITTPGSILTIVYSATRQVAGQHNIGIAGQLLFNARIRQGRISIL